MTFRRLLAVVTAICLISTLFTGIAAATSIVPLSTDNGYPLVVSHEADVATSSNSQHASNLTDGNPATIWTADSGFPQIATIDLGRDAYILGSTINWVDSSLNHFTYRIETSPDDFNYTIVVDEASSAGEDSRDVFSAEARYVRVTVTGTAQQHVPEAPVSIRHIHILGEAQPLLEHSFSGDSLPEGWIPGGNGNYENLESTEYLRAVLLDSQTIQPTFGDSQWTDYVAEVKVRSADHITMNAAFNPSLLIRGHGETERNNAYRFRLVGNNTVRLQKVSAGSATVLLDEDLPPGLTVQPQTWYTLKVEAVGNQFKFYVDGQLVLEYEDPNIGNFARGRVGLMAGNVDTYFKDVKVSPVVPRLNSILVNGSPIEGFDSWQTSYQVVLPAGTGSAQISAVAPSGTSVWLADDGQVDLIAVNDGYQQYALGAQNLDGSINYYTLYLRQASADTSLARVAFAAGEDPVLVPGQYEYQVSLPARTAAVDVLYAVPAAADHGASAEIVRPPILVDGRGEAVIRVTAENGDVRDYTFNLSVRPSHARGEVIYEEDFNSGSFKEGWSAPAIDQFSIVDDGHEKYAYRDADASSVLISNSHSTFTDADITVRVMAEAPTSYPGLAARVSEDESSFYMFTIKPDENKAALGKVVNNSAPIEPAALAVEKNIDLNKWYQLRLVLEGNSIKAYIDDELLIDIADGPGVFETDFTELSAGNAGFPPVNARAGFDDLLVTEISDENTIPVITLSGEAELTIPVGSVYTELGATAYDVEDGPLPNIVITGEVDTSTVGTYVISYNVTDSQGAAAVEVIRTVHVVEKSYAITASAALSRDKGIEATVAVKLKENAHFEHEGAEVIYFQLLRGTIPIGWTAVEKNVGVQETVLTAHFDVEDPENPEYRIKAFILDSLQFDLTLLPVSLSDLLVLE